MSNCLGVATKSDIISFQYVLEGKFSVKRAPSRGTVVEGDAGGDAALKAPSLLDISVVSLRLLRRISFKAVKLKLN